MRIHTRSYFRCAQKHHYVWECWAFDARHWLRGRYSADPKLVKLTLVQITYLLYIEAVLVGLLVWLLLESAR